MNADVWKLPPVVERFLGYRATLPLAQEQLAVMMTLLGSSDGPLTSFLDLGCGDGILGATILGRYPNCRGILADFSEPMLQLARERLHDYADRLTFLNVNYAVPDWSAAAKSGLPFDAIVSGYSIHHQPDERKRALYAELFNLLRPGGWFINVEHIAPAAALATTLFEAHIIEAHYALEVKNGGSKTRGQLAEAFHARPDKEANILAPLETQCAWLREIGYQEVDCYLRIYELAVFGGRRPNSDF